MHELHHLLTAIRDDSDVAPHGATFEDGYRCAEVCDAMLRSARSGGAKRSATGTERARARSRPAAASAAAVRVVGQRGLSLRTACCTPLFRSRPLVIAPTAKIAADHQNAVV